MVPGGKCWIQVFPPRWNWTFDLKNSNAAWMNLKKIGFLKKTLLETGKETLLLKCNARKPGVNTKNKELVIQKFLDTIQANLVVPQKKKKNHTLGRLLKSDWRAKKRQPSKKWTDLGPKFKH